MGSVYLIPQSTGDLQLRRQLQAGSGRSPGRKLSLVLSDYARQNA